MSYLTIIGLFNFLTCSFFGTYILIKNSESILSRLFFFICSSIALTNFSYIFWQLSGSAETALIWQKLMFTGGILVNPLFLHFVFIFTKKIQKKKIEISVFYIINAVFIYLNAVSFLYESLEPRFGIEYWPIPKILFHVYIIFWFLQCLYGFILLTGYFWHEENVTLKKQTKILIIAAALGFIGGGSNWFIWYNIPIHPYAYLLITIFIILMAYAILEYNFMDIKLVFSGTIIFVIIYTFILGLPLLLAYKTDYDFSSFIILFILSFIGPFLFNFLQGRVENIVIFREKHFQQLLIESTQGILKEKNIDSLAKLIVNLLKSSLNNFAALYLFDKDNKQYYLSAFEGPFQNFPEIIDKNDSVILHMYRKKEPVFNILPDNTEGNSIKKTYLYIPSFSGTTILCFLILGEKFLNVPYSRNDISTFQFFSYHIAMAVESALLMEENKKNQEMQFQAEKLAFIGGMAEGVAHRIKNRLNHFSLATAGIKLELNNLVNKNYEVLENNPGIKESIDSLKDIGESLIDNVIRTDQVIQGIINYAQAEETENFFSKIFFDEIIEGAKDLVRIKHDIDKIPIEINIDKSNIIYGIKPQLIECMYNILDNSFDAIEEKIKVFEKEHKLQNYSPKIEIYLKHSEKNYNIEIKDNGIGISEKDTNKIFAPYFTSKTSYNSKAFSGYGLFTVKRMIEENHSGKLWFESTYMERTSFFITLPAQL